MSAALERLTAQLLAERGPAGHWTGELSSSALSTALASMALHLAGGREALVDAGLAWLERTRNEDGGWGDTVLSLSNISTTALCWAAFTLTGRRHSPAGQGAEAWMHQAAGSLEPRRLADAIASRYGNDRTFSVPILTVLAVAGLVPWRLAPQLPFELAAFPQSWFRWLHLPVVSYALPALIAIGHARHRRRPTRNPLTRLARRLTGARTLHVLESIQPPNGGFLEATPLTGFVTISLLTAGHPQSLVVRRGLQFLEASVRPDGSWPIDTNLATWVTTLSVNALRDRLPTEARAPIREWLLGQQFRVRHPYTGADPGGWAWTDLPGGVPDADDTSGALLALAQLGDPDPRTVAAAELGVTWLLGLQNRDGGIPTFCRGWGKLPFDRSSQDITAHALLAWSAWRPLLSPALRQRVDAAQGRAWSYLERVQRPDGAWVPLWFGNQYAPDDENPAYGTARVLAAARALHPDAAATRRAAEWLLAVQNPDGGWGGDRGIASTVEETALATAALAGLEDTAARRGADWLATAELNPAPVGFYFARLWYYERLYPLLFAVEALERVARRTS